MTVIKDAQPDAAQDFAYTTTGAGWSDFSLDDDADADASELTHVHVLGRSTSAPRRSPSRLVTGWSLHEPGLLGGHRSRFDGDARG